MASTTLGREACLLGGCAWGLSLGPQLWGRDPQAPISEGPGFQDKQAELEGRLPSPPFPRDWTGP